MEKFKTLLRDVLQLGCDSVSLTEGQWIQAMGKQGSMNLGRYKQVDNQWLFVLYQNLFPKDVDKIRSGKPVLGVLNIAGVGKIMMVAEMSSGRSIKLFLPPRGEKLCKDYWAHLMKQAPPQSPPPVPPKKPNEAPGQAGPQQRPAPPGVQPGGAAHKAARDAAPKEQEAAARSSSGGGMAGQAEATSSGSHNASSLFALGRYSETQNENANENHTALGLRQALKHSAPIGERGREVATPEADPFGNDFSAAANPDEHSMSSLAGASEADNHSASYASGSSVSQLSNSGANYSGANYNAAAEAGSDDAASYDDAFAQSGFDEPAFGSAPSFSPPTSISRVPPPDEVFSGEGVFSVGDIDSSAHEVGGIATGKRSFDVPQGTDGSALHQGTGAKAGLPLQVSAVRAYPTAAPPAQTPVRAERPRVEVAPEDLDIDFSRAADPGQVQSDGQKAIDKLLQGMMENRASDLHMNCGQPIIFRIDGDIVRSNGKPLDDAALKTFLLPMIPPAKRAHFRTHWDIDFSYEVKGVGRFRVNLFRDYHGVGAAIRAIPSRILTASELHLPPVLLKLCRLSKGLVLVTGPTGSGKSTTLAAMVDLINQSRSEHIITVEDPIEFVYEQKRCLINQREVGRHTSSFATALRAALREDPDIVLVGELRDLETTATAIETAETGHLVLATLHTNTAVSTIDRIIDQFPPDQQRIVRNMLASSLRGVVAQTLCKKKGGGRTGAYELLLPNDAVRAMIREGKNHMIVNHMQTQQADGNCTLNDALLKLVADGSIEYWEGWKKATDKREFEELARRRRVTIPLGDPPA